MNDPQPSPPEGQPPALLAVIVGVVGSLFAVVAFLTGARTIVEGAVIVSRGFWPMLLDLATAWWTLAFVATAVVVVSGSRGNLPLYPARGRVIRWIVGIGLVAVALSVLPDGREPTPLTISRIAAGMPSARYPVDENHPHRVMSVVDTNSWGYRDAESALAPADGVTRIVVIGDSYVWGAGVPDADGLIDRQLERALGELAPERDAEVLNVAYPGWGWFSYLVAAEDAIEALAPHLVVIATLGRDDMHPIDYAQGRLALGERLGTAPLAAIVISDLHGLSVRHAVRVGQRGSATGPIANVLEREFRSLLDLASSREVPVVVWQFYDPWEFLDRLTDEPGLLVTGWPDDFPRQREGGWSGDPVLAIPNDGHPTAEGNARIADELAPQLLALLRPADVAAADATNPPSPTDPTSPADPTSPTNPTNPTNPEP